MVEAKVEIKLSACTIVGDNYKEVIQVSYHSLCVLLVPPGLTRAVHSKIF